MKNNQKVGAKYEIPKSYGLKDVEAYAELVRIKVAEMRSRAHDLDPNKVSQFAELLEAAWKFSFRGNT